MKIYGNKKVLIADDHFVVCKGIESLIKPIFNSPLFFHCHTIKQLIFEVETKTIDLLLLDVNFSDGNLLDEIIRIRKKLPNSKILVFTSGISFKEFNFLKTYVNAILSKQSFTNVFEATITNLFLNDSFLHTPFNNDKIQKINLLTEREIEVIECILKGMGNKEIVNFLDLKESTISTLRKRTLEKLQLCNNVDLINYFTESIF